jgi:glycosyltransferase involved in cell wall biosynthesis
MRIVIDARESGTSSGRYVDKLLEYLQRIDYENQYILLLKKHRLDIYSDMPSNFSTLECNIKEFTFAEQINLALLLYKIKPDLVHFLMVQQPLLYFGKKVTTMQDLTTLRFHNPSKNPLVFWVKQRVYWVVNFLAVRFSKHVIAISEYTKQDVIKTLHFKHPEKITVTLESADYIQEKPVEIDSLLGQRFISYVGRHQPHKNLERLVKAHRLLLKKYPELILAIVGNKDANSEILEKWINDMLDTTNNGKGTNTKASNVVFTGFVSDAQLKWLYRNTACYVFPSLSEGFGLPGLEAMIHGTPVASSNATCLPEVNGDGAIYFDPLNVQDMAEKISTLLSDKILVRGLVAKGKKQVSKFSWRKMAEQTLNVYRDVLNG